MLGTISLRIQRNVFKIAKLRIIMHILMQQKLNVYPIAQQVNFFLLLILNL